MSTANHSSALVRWGTGPGDGPALVCLPWAGSGAVPFRAWGPVLDGVAAVYGVRLAGRESRQTEPLAATLDEAVSALVDDLRTLDEPGVALFGQCFGAVLAFEAAKALRRADTGPEVVHLFVASQVPPSAIADAGGDPGDDLSRYVPEDLREEPEFLELLLPILRGDMALLDGYARGPETPLDVPLTVLYGEHDDLLGPAEVDGWRDETTGPVALHEVAGADHLFGGNAWPEVAGLIRDALLHAPDGGPVRRHRGTPQAARRSDG